MRRDRSPSINKSSRSSGDSLLDEAGGEKNGLASKLEKVARRHRWPIAPTDAESTARHVETRINTAVESLQANHLCQLSAACALQSKSRRFKTREGHISCGWQNTRAIHAIPRSQSSPADTPMATPLSEPPRQFARNGGSRFARKDFTLKVPLRPGYLSLPESKTKHGRKRHSRLTAQSRWPGLPSCEKQRSLKSSSALFPAATMKKTLRLHFRCSANPTWTCNIQRAQDSNHHEGPLRRLHRFAGPSRPGHATQNRARKANGLPTGVWWRLLPSAALCMLLVLTWDGGGLCLVGSAGPSSLGLQHKAKAGNFSLH